MQKTSPSVTSKLPQRWIYSYGCNLLLLHSGSRYDSEPYNSYQKFIHTINCLLGCNYFTVTMRDLSWWSRALHCLLGAHRCYCSSSFAACVSSQYACVRVTKHILRDIPVWLIAFCLTAHCHHLQWREMKSDSSAMGHREYFGLILKRIT